MHELSQQGFNICRLFLYAPFRLFRRSHAWKYISLWGKPEAHRAQAQHVAALYLRRRGFCCLRRNSLFESLVIQWWLGISKSRRWACSSFRFRCLWRTSSTTNTIYIGVRCSLLILALELFDLSADIWCIPSPQRTYDYGEHIGCCWNDILRFISNKRSTTRETMWGADRMNWQEERLSPVGSKHAHGFRSCNNAWRDRFLHLVRPTQWFTSRSLRVRQLVPSMSSALVAWDGWGTCHARFFFFHLCSLYRGSLCPRRHTSKDGVYKSMSSCVGTGKTLEVNLRSDYKYQWYCTRCGGAYVGISRIP